METELIDYQKHNLTFFPLDGIIIAHHGRIVNRDIQICSHKLDILKLMCFLAAQT